MSRRHIALGLLTGLACFALGLGAARFLGSAPRMSLVDDGGSAPKTPAEPRIVFDPGSIDLLPDASLHLDLPPGFDAGAPGRFGTP